MPQVPPISAERQLPRTTGNVGRERQNEQEVFDRPLMPLVYVGNAGNRNINTNVYRENPYGQTNDNNNKLNPYLHNVQ
jgi:hypothetical protein